MRRALLLLVLLTPLLARADTPVAPPLFGGSPEFPESWRVGSNGDGYLVAWTSYGRVHLAAIDDTGAVTRDATFDADGHVDGVVAVQENYVVLVGPAVFVVDPETLTVKEHHGTLPTATLASDRITALVVNRFGYARLLDPRGNVIAPDVQFSSAPTDMIGAAAAGGNYLVVWRDDTRLMRAVISNHGMIVSAAATLVTVDDPGHLAFGIGSVASDGETFVVSWRDGTLINAIRVSAGGTVLGPPAKLGNWEYTNAPQVVWNGREFRVVLETRTLQPGADIMALRLNGEVETVASGPALQFGSAAASTGRSTLAIWSEFATCFEAGFGGVMGRMVEPAGAVMTLSRGVAAQETPAALAQGNATLVAWIERSSLRHVRALLNGTPIEIPATSYAQDSPAIGGNGSSFLLVWPEFRLDCTTSLSAVAIGRDGRLGEVRTIAQDANTKTRPSIVWNGSEYAVMWERASVAQALAIRVSADGTPLDAKPAALTPEYPNPMFYTHRTAYPAIVWTGSAYLATWSYSRTAYIPLYPDPPAVIELRARRLDRNLAPLEAEHTLATLAYGAAFAWNGTEGRGFWAGGGKWHASRIDAGGTLLDTHDLFAIPPASAPPSYTLVWTGRDWLATAGADLVRIRPDGTLDSRVTIHSPTWASTVTPKEVVYQTDKGVVFTRAIDWLKRRSVR